MPDDYITRSDAIESLSDFPEFFRDLAREKLLRVPAADITHEAKDVENEQEGR